MFIMGFNFFISFFIMYYLVRLVYYVLNITSRLLWIIYYGLFIMSCLVGLCITYSTLCLI